MFFQTTSFNQLLNHWIINPDVDVFNMFTDSAIAEHNKPTIINFTDADTLEEIVMHVDLNARSMDIISGEEITVQNWIGSSPDNLVFYVGTQLCFIDRHQINTILSDRARTIKFACRSVNHHLVIDYANIDLIHGALVSTRAFGCLAGLVRLRELNATLGQRTSQLFLIGPPTHDIVTTSSLAMLRPGANASSASHCQEGQGDTVYTIKRIIVASGGKRKRRYSKKKNLRRTQKRRGNKRTRRAVYPCVTI